MTAPSHLYAAYGLLLESNRPMPGFGSSAEPDAPRVVVDFAGSPPPAIDEPGTPLCDSSLETLWHRADGSWLLRYVDQRNGRFWTVRYARDGSRLTIHWSDDALLADIPSVLQGPGLAAALHLRAVPMLHASVVAIDDGAVALVGAPGAGKSTTAAAFVAAGFPMMSDDLAALAIDDRGVRVHAGYPRLRTFADSARAAGLSAGDLPLLFADDFLGPKRYVDLSEDDHTFRARVAPLHAVYYLMPRVSGRSTPLIETLSTRQALPVLLQNLYSTRFLDYPRRAPLIRTIAGVSATLPVHSVQAGDDLAALPRLVEGIAAHARRGMSHD